MRALRSAVLNCGVALLLAAGRAGAQVDDPSLQSDSAFIRQRYTKREMRIPMRDGTRLFTVAYVPTDASAGKRYPILLQRTPFSAAPYGADAYPTTLGPDRFMLRDGYIFVQQEVRGRYLSEGTFENVRPLLGHAAREQSSQATDEATDAADTIDWLLTHLAGNNGRVGLLGVSYGGYYAAAAALSKHPAIVATSLQAPVVDFFFEDFHHNGVLLQGHLFSYPVFGTTRTAPTAANWWLPEFLRVGALATGSDYAFQLGLGALSNVTTRVYPNDVWWRSMVKHPNYDAYWQARSMPRRLTGITTPVLVVGGWFDTENLYGTLEAYRALRQRSPAANVSIVMGPFGHRDWGARDATHTVHGNLYFGDSLALRFQRDIEAPFFRAHLKGERAAPPTGALVFDTGRNQWKQFTRWPAPLAASRAYFLRERQTLSTNAASGARTFAEFVSDPATPVPSRCTGPTIEDGSLYHYITDDQRCISPRADVAVFRGETLTDDVTFAGPITATIAFSTTGTDADVVVKLVDVYPASEPNHPFQRDTTVRMAGYELLVRGEIMRARFRRSFSAPVPLTPDAITEVTITLPDVFHTFRKGHRIMVQVQGSWFPLFDRNPQRWTPNIFTARDSDFVKATHRVWIGGARGSRLEATVLR